MLKVFISHSSVDKPFVRDLADDLKSAGIQVWLDEDVIKPGMSIPKSISNGLNESDFTVLILSSNFLNSNWADWEANAAIADAINNKKTSVIPILIEDVWNNVSPLIRDKLYLDFRNYKNLLDYRRGLEKLLSTLLGPNTSVKVVKNPTILVTGGRDPKQVNAHAVAYELGKLLGASKYNVLTVQWELTQILLAVSPKGLRASERVSVLI